jgi:hypothetical protein
MKPDESLGVRRWDREITVVLNLATSLVKVRARVWQGSIFSVSTMPIYDPPAFRVNSSAINSACLSTVSVASACISGG